MPAKPFSLTAFEPEYSENDIEDLAKKYWKVRGWTVIRQHVGNFRTRSGQTIKIGTAGMTDYLVLKAGRNGRGLIAYVEIKRPGEKPDPHQVDWMRNARLQGFEAVWFDSLPPLAAWFDAKFGPRHDGCTAQ